MPVHDRRQFLPHCGTAGRECFFVLRLRKRPPGFRREQVFLAEDRHDAVRVGFVEADDRRQRFDGSARLFEIAIEVGFEFVIQHFQFGGIDAVRVDLHRVRDFRALFAQHGDAVLEDGLDLRVAAGAGVGAKHPDTPALQAIGGEIGCVIRYRPGGRK